VFRDNAIERERLAANETEANQSRERRSEAIAATIHGFEQSVANLKMGMGAATGVVMMALLFVGSLIYMRVFRFDEDPTQ